MAIIAALGSDHAVHDNAYHAPRLLRIKLLDVVTKAQWGRGHPPMLNFTTSITLRRLRHCLCE
jgi:hypothetical protein